jgi:hypothetical protein
VAVYLRVPNARFWPVAASDGSGNPATTRSYLERLLSMALTQPLTALEPVTYGQKRSYRLAQLADASR